MQTEVALSTPITSALSVLLLSTTTKQAQRGQGEWLSTGFSNQLQVELLRGKNMIQVKYVTPQNVNMNGDVNTALLDYMRIIKK